MARVGERIAKERRKTDGRCKTQDGRQMDKVAGIACVGELERHIGGLVSLIRGMRWGLRWFALGRVDRRQKSSNS